ncbi:ketopantoate hydroxymethyltransferase [Paenibacillus yanchengensis]|uniref:Ketopantoate hydroxymethyltransferase n=1 Tax=Paenibacillus yanchengensis TaxID=2035833 RepID=A0ABW4YNE9_9BACL
MITAELLNSMANYVADRVTKVVLNGIYTITSFEVKIVNDNLLALNYIVRMTDISLITLIELKDDADNVLTSNEVNVPITADHMMMQTITVKEVN